MKAALSVLAAALLGYVGVTWFALEAGGVAVLETTDADGTMRSTHVWFVEPEGELWVEAGTPENPWFVDVRRRPEIRFTADGNTGRYRAQVMPGPDSQPKIRELLREKYGWRDAWVGVLVDTSGSVAVKLEPLP